METLVFCKKCEKLNRVPNEKALLNQAICGNCKSELNFHDAIQEVSDVGLQKIIRSSATPVIVDFWAEWCGPCKSFAPTFKAAAKDFQGKTTFLKVNTELNPASSNTFQIRSIPTLIVFKNGKEIERQSGALPLQSLKKLIEKNI